MSEIKIGSKVKLLDGGEHYPRFQRAKELGLTSYDPHIAYNGVLWGREGEVFTIVAIDSERVGAEDKDGNQYVIHRNGVEFVENPEPGLADRLELFDRVNVNGFKFIVVTDHEGNKALLGEGSGWVAPEDVTELAAIEIYSRPIYTSDLFNFDTLGSVKWRSEKAVKVQELTEKVTTLQDELLAAKQELAALN